MDLNEEKTIRDSASRFLIKYRNIKKLKFI